MPPKKDAAAELAQKMVNALESQRALGDSAYPLTLQRLAVLADPDASPTVIDQARSRKIFKDRITPAQKVADPLVVLRADIDRLAGDSRLLVGILESVCTPEAPTWPVNKLTAKLDSKLKKPFEAAVKRRIQESTLPPGVGLVLVKNKPHLFLQRLPPPPPVEIQLAERMVRALEAQRLLAGSAYPVPIKRLVELTGIPAKPALLKKAQISEFFRSRAAAVLHKHTNPLIALTADVNQLAVDPRFVESVLRALRTGDAQAFALRDLKAKVVSSLQPAFAAAVEQQITTDQLAPAVGWLVSKKNKLLFLMEDIHGRHEPPGAASAEPRPAQGVAPGDGRPPAGPVDFATAFEEAFRRLDRHAGAHNFVSLVDLRRELPVDRNTFDRELRRLRVGGAYSLSAAEGRLGISREEQEAGIREEGTLLLYVSRRMRADDRSPAPP